MYEQYIDDFERLDSVIIKSDMLGVDVYPTIVSAIKNIVCSEYNRNAGGSVEELTAAYHNKDSKEININIEYQNTTSNIVVDHMVSLKGLYGSLVKICSALRTGGREKCIAEMQARNIDATISIMSFKKYTGMNWESLAMIEEKISYQQLLDLSTCMGLIQKYIDNNLESNTDIIINQSVLRYAIPSMQDNEEVYGVITNRLEYTKGIWKSIQDNLKAIYNKGK